MTTTMPITVEKHDYNVNGLRVQAFSGPNLLDSSKPIVILIALHGRLGSAEDMEPTAHSILQWVDNKKTNHENQRDLVVVTSVLRVKLTTEKRYCEVVQYAICFTDHIG